MARHTEPAEYQQEKRRFVSEWANQIEKAAGLKSGSGRRGIGKDQDLERLLEGLVVEYSTWQKYKHGKNSPSPERFAQINKTAQELGYVGQSGGFLRKLLEMSGFPCYDEWQAHKFDYDPAYLNEDYFAMLEHEEWMWSESRAQELEQKALQMLQEAEQIRCYNQQKQTFL